MMYITFTHHYSNCDTVINIQYKYRNTSSSWEANHFDMFLSLCKLKLEFNLLDQRMKAAAIVGVAAAAAEVSDHG